MLCRLAFAVILTFPLAASPTTRPTNRPSLSASPISNALLGLPSDATTKASNKTDYLLVKPFFVASYNSDAGEPNWVSWVLTKDDLGDAPRKRTFDTDTTLPIGFKRIKTKEYANSGFDRGHMCPHSDRAATPEEADSTFIMTNIVPQAPNVNRKAWEQLEEYQRRLAEQGITFTSAAVRPASAVLAATAQRNGSARIVSQYPPSAGRSSSLCRLKVAMMI